MVRRATMQDISRIAEIIVFGKRVAYRHIFNNDLVSFNELQVIDLFKKYQKLIPFMWSHFSKGRESEQNLFSIPFQRLKRIIKREFFYG